MNCIEHPECARGLLHVGFVIAKRLGYMSSQKATMLSGPDLFWSDCVEDTGGFETCVGPLLVGFEGSTISTTVSGAEMF